MDIQTQPTGFPAPRARFTPSSGSSPFVRLGMLSTALLVGFLVGCPQSEDQSDKRRVTEAAAELERLRALPYAGGVRGSENDDRSGVIHFEPERCSPGYNLFAIQYQSRAELIDLEGNVINSWSGEPGGEWLHSNLLDNGNLIVVGADPRRAKREGPGPADDERFIMQLDWNNNVVWKRQIPAHHEADTIPNSNLLLTLTLRRRVVPSVDPVIPIRDDMIALLDSSGELVKQVSIIDVLQSPTSDVELHIGKSQMYGGGRWIDPIHANAAEWVPPGPREGTHPIFERGNVLTCMRHQNLIAVINFYRQELIWSWGHKILSGPHDAQFLDNGHILVFDNGINPQRQWSRVVEMDPLTDQIVWEYRAPEPTELFTVGKGAAQRLPNGNTLIESSDQAWAFEVTREGDIVWEFLCPHRNPNGERATIVRMKRYEPDFIERLLDANADPQPADTP